MAIYKYSVAIETSRGDGRADAGCGLAVSRRRSRAARRRRGGFTLVEILVALAIFSLLLTVILVPINLSLDLLHIGRARSEVQLASQITLSQLQRELSQAVYVFPNAELPGVTTRAPYKDPASNASLPPYWRITEPSITDDVVNGSGNGQCDGGATRVNNTARIDFLVPRRVNGALATPVTAEYYLVTYYARRLVVANALIDNVAFTVDDPMRNPYVLFRAQTPYRVDASSTFNVVTPTGALNADLSARRYLGNASCTMPAVDNRGAMWLTQSERGEPNLEPLTRNDAGDIAGSHSLVTPRDMVLVTTSDGTVNTPTTSFVCEDVNSDGKIDRVQVSLELAQFDQGGASRNDQRVRFPKVIDLPNIR